MTGRGACDGRVALVTGASRGIGKAIATRLAAEGAAVAICSRPRPGMGELTLEAARDTIASMAASGGDVLAVHVDLGDPTVDRASLVDAVERELGPVDVLVNNVAGGAYEPFLSWTDDTIASILELNFWAPWHLCRRVVPGMVERGRGWIVNLSSASAIEPSGPPFASNLPTRVGTIYGGTKAFLNRWTVSLAAELYGTGVAANTLAPQSAAETEVLVAHSNIPEHLFEPLDTMAEAALALATADPSTLTGQVTYSLQLLADLRRPVYDLSGTRLLEGWQPDDLPPRIQRMADHLAGRTTAAPSNVGSLMSSRPERA